MKTFKFEMGDSFIFYSGNNLGKAIQSFVTDCSGYVTWIESIKEVGDIPTTVNSHDDLVAHLHCAIGHIEHMAAWIGEQRAGYSFEPLGEDMPDMRAALKARAKEQGGA